ncbi:hypothetical protein PTKIN_Ptkin16aG0029000 [Pterospermum kingtungense]
MRTMDSPGSCKGKAVEKNAPIMNGSRHIYREKQVDLSHGALDGGMRPGNGSGSYNETWVPCDASHKWRKLTDSSRADAKATWFCSMNAGPAYQISTDPEEHGILISL